MFRPETLRECSVSGVVMTTTLDDVRKKRDEPSADPAATAELARLAQEQSLSLPGPDGQFEQFTKTVLENVLNEEMSEYLGDGKNQAPPVHLSADFPTAYAGPGQCVALRDLPRC